MQDGFLQAALTAVISGCQVRSAIGKVDPDTPSSRQRMPL